MKSLFLNVLLVLNVFALNLCVTVPSAYKDLAEEIAIERVTYHQLLLNSQFEKHQEDVDEYFAQVSQAFAVGNALDLEINSDEGSREDELRSAYLKELRALEKPRKYLKQLYYNDLKEAMLRDDEPYVTYLVTRGPTILAFNTKLKKEVLAYSMKHKKLQEYSAVKYLQDEKKLDEISRAYTQKMQDEYKAYQEVLKKQEALKLRKLLIAKKKGGVIVYANEEKGDISFVIENLFEMHVSATLYVTDIQGYSSKETLPFKVVLKPKEKRNIVRLVNSDKKKAVGNFKSHLSWSKGAVDAKPELDFIYALPFKRSQRVSQGFNGTTSHRGNAKYAVDFALAKGTKVYASRAGTVVEVVQRHNKHGMSLKMRQFANYVIIEHSDKTLGRYFHLSKDGVKVKLGAKVKKGDLIAISGDTGRTSGAHLHFVVTKAEVYKEGYRSVSVPIKFLCSQGVLTEPLSGHSYCTQTSKSSSPR
jgi:murein DD-endopeptidase MepM/ murein hydrolase activator NlpD